MAGMGDEDEFKDAEDGGGNPPPPSSSPASTPSKSKPAAAAGGFGSRLLASIRVPTSLSAAIGRTAPSSPKPPAPQPPAGPNLGLGLLLLHQDPQPMGDGSFVSDASVRTLHLPPTPDPQKQQQEVLGEQGAAEEGEDQVIGHGVGAGREQPVLAPMGEEGREKEDVADDGCPRFRNGDLDNEGEEQRSDELGVAMEDQEVMEQEGATTYYTAVEFQSSNNAEQWAGDAAAAIKDDSAVEEKKTVEEGCAVGILGESEDGGDGGLQEDEDDNVVEEQEMAVDQEAAIDTLSIVKHCVDMVLREEDMVVEARGEYDISGQDQYNVVKQCTSDELEVGLGDSTVHDQEVVVEQAEYVAPEDHNSNTSVMQCTGCELSEVKDSNIVRIKEKALEQEGEFGILRAAENCIAVGLQGEDNLVVEGQDGDGISVQDQHKVVEQCITDDLGVAMGDSMVQDQEVVVLDLEGVTRCLDAAVEDQSNNCAAELCTGDELEATKDASLVEEKKAAVVEGAIGILGSAKDDIKVKSQEEGDAVVMSEEDRVVVSLLQDHYKGVKQCTSDQVRTTSDVNAAHEQEVVEQEGTDFVKPMGDIAVDAHEKEVEQFAGDQSRAIKDTKEQDVTKGGSAVESQEDEGVAVNEKSEDGISVQDQGKVVEQCASDQWGTAMDDNAAKDQEVRREKIKICVSYPQRPGRPNCVAYMSTGNCVYGLSCYYNHPQLKAKSEVPNLLSEQRNCEAVQILELNRVGLPIRENARNCMHYMRNRACRYGKRCCFNHPEHVLDIQLYRPTGWDDTNLPSSPRPEKSSSPHSKNSYEHATIDDRSSTTEILPPNILHMLFPPQTVPLDAEANERKAKKDPDWSLASDDSDGCCSADSSGGPLCKQEHHVDYPERPGRQECPFVLKYGNCRFETSCQYYHPNDKFARKFHLKDPSPAGEPMFYPDRPSAPECPFYMKTGTCKFGTDCKFHHPKDFPPRMHGPTIPKGHVDAKELQPETKIKQDFLEQQQNYPERPGQPECRYYMQFGKCKYLSACKFHHPKDRVPDMPECPFYMKTGACQFGSACEFYHPEHRYSSKGGEIDDGIENGHGYPERPGVNECSHYMKHGYCKFQMNCKFHHPADIISRK